MDAAPSDAGDAQPEIGDPDAACVFYATLTGHASMGIEDRPGSVSEAEDATLQGIADSEVFDSTR